MEGTKTLQLTDILPLLEGQNTEVPYFFVNPGGSLQTFFTYKGTLIEINKLNLRGKIQTLKKEEISEEIRVNLVNGLQKGYWLVFDVDSNSTFNLKEFFSQFLFYDDNFFNFPKLFDKKYLVEREILKPDEDKDFFGNKGSYKVDERSRIFFLSTFAKEELTEFKDLNSGIKFNYTIIE
jgi:hypothetical protein